VLEEEEVMGAGVLVERRALYQKIMGGVNTALAALAALDSFDALAALVALAGLLALGARKMQKSERKTDDAEKEAGLRRGTEEEKKKSFIHEWPRMATNGREEEKEKRKRINHEILRQAQDR
jgi:hypothetical protein